MKRLQLLVFTFTLFLGLAAQAKIVDMWPRVPFNLVGANLCEFRSAYSQTRSEYMDQMVYHAQNLLMSGDYNPTQTLMTINRMYERNLVFARLGLGVTLENTFKAYLEQYYTDLKPRIRNLEFKHVLPISNIINQALRAQQTTHISQADANKIDLFAYGSYTLSPNCNGNVIVTLNVINRDGVTKTYMGSGRAQYVMSQIASKVFEDYQRTKFPSTLRIGSKTLTLIGGFNGDIDKTSYLEEAQGICTTLGGRLPTSQEYKYINSYGSWSGGITLGRKIWALNYPNVFVPFFERHPVRPFNQVNDREYYYTCVK